MKAVLVLFGLAVVFLAYVVYSYTGSKEYFTDIGGSCNPEIENTCGKDAICQASETGKSGICFPKPDEEKEKTE